MPGSKIEAELSKVTKTKQGAKEDRQTFLTALCAGIQNLSDAKWEALSDEAQEWANAAATAVKAKKKIKDFPDVGSVPADDEEEEAPKAKKKQRAAEPDDEEEEEEEEEEKPAKKKKAAPAEEEEEEEEEEEKPAKKKKPAVEEEEEEEEEEEKPAKSKRKAKAELEEEEEEEEEEKPATKKKAAKPAEEEEEEEDEPKPKKKKPAAAPSKTSAPAKASGSGIKDSIKLAIFNDPEIGVDDLVKKLGKSGAKVSKVTVSNIRAEYRHTIKFLKAQGAKGLEAK